jgi:hypothetical protein
MWRLTGGVAGVEYSGYVVRAKGEDEGLNEEWYAYEWVPRMGEHGEHVWVAKAPTREAAQTAVRGEFLCEVFRSDERGHCPYPGAVVRTTEYKGKRLSMVACGEHSGVLKGWDTMRLWEYRKAHGLLPDSQIIGDRITPTVDNPPTAECVRDAFVISERNAWIAVNRAVRPLAKYRYWWGHLARFPDPVNVTQFRDARTQWQHAYDHAKGMWAVYMREAMGYGPEEEVEFPTELDLLIEREAAEELKARTRQIHTRH